MNRIEKKVAAMIEKDLFNVLLVGIEKNKYYCPVNIEDKATDLDYMKYDIIKRFIEDTGEKIYIYLAENNINVYKVDCFLYNNNDIEITINAETLNVTYLYKNIYNK